LKPRELFRKFETRNPKQIRMIQRESTKSEARNSKQIQMTKKHNVPNNADSESSFWNCSGFELFAAVCFEFRYSDFGFVSLVAWRDNIFCHFTV